ncbi:MAG: outer membrane protein assembly factor BamE [Rickettsiales bacterium]
MGTYRGALTALLAGMACITQSCIETKQESGYNFRQKHTDDAELNGMSRREVYARLGSPSSVSAVDVEKWLYIGSETGRKSIFDPKMKKLRILEIAFDGEGKVASWHEYGNENIRPIDFNDDETPTAGHSVGALEQLIGNIGRFSGAEAPVEPE